MTGQENKNHAVRGITILALIHAIISLFLWITLLIYVFMCRKRSPQTRTNGLTFFFLFLWFVSLLLCGGILLYIYYYWKFDKQAQQTPCPFQFSFSSTTTPGGENQERQEIRSVIQWMSSSLHDILPYEKNTIYMIMTAYDLKKISLLDSSSHLPEIIHPLISSFQIIPIGRVLHGRITDLRGIEVWPLIDNKKTFK